MRHKITMVFHDLTYDDAMSLLLNVPDAAKTDINKPPAAQVDSAIHKCPNCGLTHSGDCHTQKTETTRHFICPHCKSKIAVQGANAGESINVQCNKCHRLARNVTIQ